MLPKPYPDEIVGSVLLRGRQHSHLPLKPFLAWIFGVDTGRSSASFVLGHAITRIARLAGLPAAEFLHEHTVFPYVVAYRCLAEVQTLASRVLADHLPPTSSTASLAQAVTGAVPHRRYCPQCVREEMQRYGETYWHRMHQLPTALRCPVHDVLLRVARIRARITAQPQELTLPSNSPLALACPNTSMSAARSMLKCTEHLMSAWHVGHAPRHHHYQNLARALGYVHASGELATGALAQAIVRHYGSSFLAQLDCAVVGITSQSWPALLLRSGVTEPSSVVRHVLLEAFLQHSLSLPRKAIDLPKRNYPVRNYAALDDRATTAVRKMLVAQPPADRGRLTVKELLESMGIRAAYKHHPERFPNLRAVIQDFRRSSLAQRQLGGREYWRKRNPARWGLQGKRAPSEAPW